MFIHKGVPNWKIEIYELLMSSLASMGYEEMPLRLTESSMSSVGDEAKLTRPLSFNYNSELDLLLDKMEQHFVMISKMPQRISDNFKSIGAETKEINNKLNEFVNQLTGPMIHEASMNELFSLIKFIKSAENIDDSEFEIKLKTFLDGLDETEK